MSTQFARVRATVIDGRMSNVYWRQTQLRSLHDVLLKYANELETAIVQGTGCPKQEASVEVIATVDYVRAHFTTIDPKKELEEEYSIKNGKDAKNRRHAIGLVYIVPTTHTMLFSLITALSTAISAGNCVIVQLENTLRSISPIIEKVLREGVDQDILDVARTPVHVQDISNDSLRLDQVNVVADSNSIDLVSPAQAHAVAIVDRTADIEEAAQHLVAARFSFGGTSPYAPDLVLVNEFVKKDFTAAVLKYCNQRTPSTEGHLGEKSPSRNGSNNVAAQTLTDKLGRESEVNVISRAAHGSVVDILKRNLLPFESKVKEPLLCIHSVTSIDDAVDLITEKPEQLLALYTYADSASSKYMCQFVKSHAAFVNHIPTELLLGPAAPSAYTTSSTERYRTEMFSIPSPAFVDEPPTSLRFKETIQSESSVSLTKLRSESLQPLPRDQRPKKFGIGFFEQGILLGLGMFATPIIAGLSVGTYYGCRWVWMRWK